MKKGFVSLVLAGLVIGSIPAVPASGSMSDDDFFQLAGRRNWLSYADARPVSPFFGIPGELKPSAPFARSYLDASPGRSECFASLYYPDEVIEEGVLQTTGHYENRTMARTQNPDVGNGTKKEIAPLGDAGPRAKTENPSRTECFSEAISGVGPGEAEGLVDSGYAKTHAVFDGDAVVTDEAVSRVTGVSLGAIRIAAMETRLKLEYHLDGEPVISYAMNIVGVEADGKPVAGIGAGGIVLGGEQVAGRDLIDQFNAEVEKNGAALQEQAWADYIRLVAPTVEKDSDGGVHATGPVLEIGQVNTFRKDQGGSHFGLRLGYASVYAILNSLGGLGADAGEIPLDAPGGSPLGASTGDGSGGGDGLLSASAGTGTASGPSGDGLLGVALGPEPVSASARFGSAGGYTTAAGDIPAAPTADSAAAPAETALPATNSLIAPGAGVGTSAQLAVAESRRAARNTANGLLGGILLLAGAVLWVGGMAVFGRKAA